MLFVCWPVLVDWCVCEREREMSICQTVSEPSEAPGPCFKALSINFLWLHSLHHVLTRKAYDWAWTLVNHRAAVSINLQKVWNFGYFRLYFGERVDAMVKDSSENKCNEACENIFKLFEIRIYLFCIIYTFWNVQFAAGVFFLKLKQSISQSPVLLYGFIK